ncbi:type II toxin-antitoxin system RelB/DinJ family antitoxin [Streptococcus equinus]|uniref:type II toxin-antitoxin system RelB/DinJ family antitoxin n=1 Tax=Streptococcus equinus TaxID=1335 RepID=UPI0008879BAD|nr:type II toxin-antitoxin system RelB/DinJ family antitoxin [Streptococcus equinus]SDI51905.1 DNA-damage-inducible protein J [Streptococcus equinus]SEP65957.1 DNA-damage-inducible protein J [Streptococcus equinus]
MQVSTITVRVDDDLKKEAAALYKDLGMDMSTAITVFLKQSVKTQSIPFQIKRYNETTEKAFCEAEQGQVKSFDSVDELFEDLNH